MTIASHTNMGDTLCFCIREAFLLYVFRVLLSNTLYHPRATCASSDTSYRERQGNRNIFILSLTLSGSSVNNSKLRIRPATAWYMREGFI